MHASNSIMWEGIINKLYLAKVEWFWDELRTKDPWTRRRLSLESTDVNVLSGKGQLRSWNWNETLTSRTHLRQRHHVIPVIHWTESTDKCKVTKVECLIACGCESGWKAVEWVRLTWMYLDTKRYVKPWKTAEREKRCAHMVLPHHQRIKPSLEIFPCPYVAERKERITRYGRGWQKSGYAEEWEWQRGEVEMATWETDG